MSMYKYVIFISFLFFSCEKNNSGLIDNNNQIHFMICESSPVIDHKIKVMSFNRLNNTSLNSVSEVIEVIQPDIIGLQESYDIGPQIADRFNYCFYGNPNTSTAVLSRYPIEVVNEIQSKIFLTDSLYLNFFNIHLPAFPYQPYDIRDTLITTPSQAIFQAEQTRGIESTNLVELVDATKHLSNMPIIVVGDFNEPSHLDWVIGAENPINFQIPGDSDEFVVEWPTSKKMLDLSLIDTYREIYLDPINYPGYTWTPFFNINEVHDRIDYIYYIPHTVSDLSLDISPEELFSITLESVSSFGPDNLSSIIIENYESDHRGVLAIFELAF